MRKFLILCGGMLCLALFPAVPSARAQQPPNLYQPENTLQLGMGYQFQHYNVFGRSFNNNGYNVDLYAHIVDWLTDTNWRITLGGEGTSDFGFGTTGGNPNLTAKSLFLAAGPRVAFENRSRVDPWLHGLVGWERFRFTQTSTLGVNSSLGFTVGGGVDVNLSEGFRWRVQADYLGTTLQKSEQSNYSIGTGFVLVFLMRRA